MSENPYIMVYYDGCKHLRYLLRRDQSVSDPMGCECHACLPVERMALMGKCPVCEAGLLDK